MRVKSLAVLVTCLVLSSVARADDTKAGTLATKPIAAAAEVVAVLNDGTDTITLTATGDIATKLDELAKKGAKVSVTGTVNGKTMAVTGVMETADPKAENKDDGKKKKKGEKGEKKKKKAEKNNN